MSNDGSREFDIVLVGSTGFVGRLTAHHLAVAAPAGARIALAGRDRSRVEEVARSVGHPQWPTVVVDVTDAGQVAELAARTAVVISTVGPYRSYGAELVAACAAAGTDYVDLTGEVLFVADSVRRNHEAARRTGARIVHSCGFDSIPSDLTTDLIRHEAARQGHPVPDMARLYVTDARGGISGGTAASLLGQLEEARRDPQARRRLGDPLALAPGGVRAPRVPEPLIGRDPALDDAWIAPFFMSSYNSRVVQRSQMLRDAGALAYSEHIRTGDGPKGAFWAAVVGGLTVGSLLVLGAAGPLAERMVPKAGDGPSPKARARGRYAVRTVGLGHGRRYEAGFADHRDPGYDSTAVMLGESALALAFDDVPAQGGVLTPAVAMRDQLVHRLREQGFRISVRTV